jgi:hypothetical protein
MNGATVAYSAFLPTIADTNWEIQGVDDFNGDGKADVLWRNKATGQNVVWLMNGATVSLAAFLPTIADTDWNIVGVGDLDRDGHADLVWRNQMTGQNIAWLMNGAALGAAAFLPALDANWAIGAVGDINGDRKVDLVWRNTTTSGNMEWLMNGVVVSFSGDTYPVPLDTDMVAIGDTNGDGYEDLIWRNRVTGVNFIWPQNGMQYPGLGGFSRQLPTPTGASPAGKIAERPPSTLQVVIEVEQAMAVVFPADRRLFERHGGRRNHVREIGPRPVEHLRIVYGDLVREVLANPPQPLDHAHRIRVKIAFFAEPRVLHEVRRLHDERVAFPASDRVAVIGRVGVGAVFPAVGRHDAERVSRNLLVEKHELAGQLDDPPR